MKRSTRASAAVGTALMATVTACGSSGSGGSTSAGTSSTSAVTSSTAGSGGKGLSLTKTSLGSVVAGPNGRVVYLFDKDSKGTTTSACTGPCLTAWPPATVTGAPKSEGVTGTVGTITTADGKKQLTLDGRPLYYFAGDKAAADVNGQGVQGIWWVVTSSGSKVTSTAGGGAY